MINRTRKRPLLEAERELLTRLSKGATTTAARWRQAAGDAIVAWLILMVLFFAVWAIIAWAVRVTLHIEMGRLNATTAWIAVLAGLASAAYAVMSSVRWVKACPDNRSKIRADLDEGLAIEESYEFSAAKRFEEPEHGGLFYYLRTTDDKVMVVIDEESTELGVRGEDPLRSKFQPCTELLIIRAPRTKYVLSKKFSGEPLHAGDPKVFSLAPELWPESESFCKIPWDDLEDRLCKEHNRK
jgi:hypothetical protein